MSKVRVMMVMDVVKIAMAEELKNEKVSILFLLYKMAVLIIDRMDNFRVIKVFIATLMQPNPNDRVNNPERFSLAIQIY